ncbi:MAG TPA: hypothetical protein DCE41_15525 [Cytophagales bacterium]|nr:hypothetical protein [Cytophagales bacterium]HAA20281.1 hypothetical protein [Cytophagales bacterium]HAP63166.1 hypothetical protein [Cytophagales bacterium]
MTFAHARIQISEKGSIAKISAFFRINQKILFSLVAQNMLTIKQLATLQSIAPLILWYAP